MWPTTSDVLTSCGVRCDCPSSTGSDRADWLSDFVPGEA